MKGQDFVKKEKQWLVQMEESMNLLYWNIYLHKVRPDILDLNISQVRFMSGKVVLYFYIVILAVLVYYRIIIAEMYGRNFGLCD